MSADAYLAARDVFKECEGRVQAMAKLLADVAGKLGQAPSEIMFANAPAAMPMEVALGGRTLSVDADAWPTPAQINTLVGEYVEKKRTMLAAWQAVPRTQQAAFQPPFAAGRTGY